MDYRNHSSVLLRYDGTVPQITEVTGQDPEFDPYWLNQDSAGEATINIKYNESHLQLISLESEKLNYSIVLKDPTPASGENISFALGLNIRGKPDGVFELKISLIDSAGNNKSAIQKLSLYATPPTGTEASSPDTRPSITFTVPWSGT